MFFWGGRGGNERHCPDDIHMGSTEKQRMFFKGGCISDGVSPGGLQECGVGGRVRHGVTWEGRGNRESFPQERKAKRPGRAREACEQSASTSGQRTWLSVQLCPIHLDFCSRDQTAHRGKCRVLNPRGLWTSPFIRSSCQPTWAKNQVCSKVCGVW